MIRLYYFLFIAFVFGACTDIESSPDFHYETLPVDDVNIPDQLDFDKEHEITMKYTLPSSCYYFDRLYYTKKDSVRTLAIIALVDDESVCTQETKEGEYKFKLKTTQKEDYLFKIYKGVDAENKAVFDTIVSKTIEVGSVN